MLRLFIHGFSGEENVVLWTLDFTSLEVTLIHFHSLHDVTPQEADTDM
jgi:hypothetical protein